MAELPRDVLVETEIQVNGEPHAVRVDSDRRVFVEVDGRWRELGSYISALASAGGRSTTISAKSGGFAAGHVTGPVTLGGPSY